MESAKGKAQQSASRDARAKMNLYWPNERNRRTRDLGR